MSVLTRIESVAPRDTTIPVGLAAGTNVRTPCGLRHVENLRPGDLVVTRNDGLQPLRMIWKQTICGNEVAADPSLAPVVIPPRAIGPMMPQAELRVAASHMLLIPGYRIEGQSDTTPRLMRARDFAEICEEVRIDRSGEDAVYYNLVFDSQFIFAANGVPVESFLPDARIMGALGEAARAEFEHLVPHLVRAGEDAVRPLWETEVRVHA